MMCAIYMTIQEISHSEYLKKGKGRLTFDECADWNFEDIKALTVAGSMEKKNLNG